MLKKTYPSITQQEMEKLAIKLSSLIVVGDLVFMRGSLGAGKSTFVRALLRHRAQDPWLEVPSPTFTLVQPYTQLTPPLFHLDLYRLTSVEEVLELGMDDMLAQGSVMAEWPELLQEAGYQPTLTVCIEGDKGEMRDVCLEGKAKFLHN